MSQHNYPWLGQGRQQPKKETSNMKTKRTELKTKPEVEIHTGDKHNTTYQIYIVNPGERVKITNHKSMWFPYDPCDTTPSLVYVRLSSMGIEAEECDVNDASKWAWIQKLMQEGLNQHNKGGE